ncbi:ORF6N domain-containing protein, partial [Candidatus Uhrbacteria bacterium]|nr:ORF6N domain-containing protein [Candidatus Uhrbacteria bacterium]
MEKHEIISIPEERIEAKIYMIRGKKVMLDRDLAVLYKVTTKALNQAVKRNLERFSKDFMFKLSLNEAPNLKSQIVTSSSRSQIVTLNPEHGGRRKPT